MSVFADRKSDSNNLNDKEVKFRYIWDNHSGYWEIKGPYEKYDCLEDYNSQKAHVQSILYLLGDDEICKRYNSPKELIKRYIERMKPFIIEPYKYREEFHRNNFNPEITESINS